MDLPLLSQIPSLVLSKLDPSEVKSSRKRKEVKFYEEDIIDLVEGSSEEIETLSDEVTSSGNGSESQDSHGSPTSCRSIEVVAKSKPVKSVLKSTKKLKTAPIIDTVIEDRHDAIVQTDLMPEMISRSTQTIKVYPFNIPDEELTYDDYKSQLQAQSLEFRSNIYPIPKRNGKAPPLKIGLTLPKGRKRKVFYPDDEE